MSTDSIIDAIAEVEAAPKVKLGRKAYTQVADRIVAFRRNFAPEDWGIVTSVLKDDGEIVQVHAALIYYAGEEDRVISTGLAEEVRGSSNINKTSAIENCETSAIGRCLAGFGLHGGEYASAGEVSHAIAEQEKPAASAETIAELLAMLTDHGMTPGAIDVYRASLRIAKWQDLTAERADRILEKMRAKYENEQAADAADTRAD